VRSEELKAVLIPAILYGKEKEMQTQTMTFEEELDITVKAIELRRSGDEEGYYRIMKSLPMQPWLAKIFKEKWGADVLIQSGCNLSAAEAEFGPDWLRN